MTSNDYGRLLLISFGNIQHSRGAGVYLLSLIDAMRQSGGVVRPFFLQSILPGSPAVGNGSDAVSVISPPFGGCARFLPRALWRIYELLWANWCGLHIARADSGWSEICILAGPGLLPLTRVLRARYRIIYIQHG